MERVKSRYKLLTLLLLIFFILLALLSWYGFFKVHDDIKFHRRMLFTGILFTVISVLGIFKYLKEIPVITISGAGISLHYMIGDDKLIAWEDIKQIKLVSVKTLAIDGNGSRIDLIDGSSWFISADYYGNIKLIRQCLQYHVSRHKNEAVSHGRQTGLPGEPLTTYTGNAWLSMNNILFLALGIPLILFIISAGTKGFFFLPILLLLYLYTSWQMFYFQLSGDVMIVRNHYWFWYKRTYLTGDMETCIFESKTKGSSAALRIICHDFSSKSYKAGSLRKNHWQDLRDKLKLLNIKTINESWY